MGRGGHYDDVSIFSRPKIQNFGRKLRLSQTCSVCIQYLFSLPNTDKWHPACIFHRYLFDVVCRMCVIFPSFGRWLQCALDTFLACVMFCVESALFHRVCYRAVWSWWSHNILKKGVLIRGGFQRQCQKTNYFILFPLADDKYARCVDFLSMSFLFPVGHFLVHLFCFRALWSWELIPCQFSLSFK